jgi:uncharacterized protein YjbI with pentapeptide repeats
MKIYKKNDLSLLIKTFGVADTLYMAVTALVYFDLNDPDNPLKEQDLWQAVPAQLGEQVFDAGLPKPRGEVLVTGKCFVPKGRRQGASRVSWRVGRLSKTLDVFGQRYWKINNGVVVGITPAESFTQMPIIYQNAYGGPEYKPNPIGKGRTRITTPDERTLMPLPNIEYPDRLIGTTDDVPPPAGFGPLDVMWSPRADKVGTYDDKWQAERWPYYPDDFNPEFFNTAPQDQFLDEYFKGDETIEIINMHPELPGITSRMPRVRVRCFVTHQKNMKAGPEEDVFEEVTPKVDTLWLFPEIMRGVAMYRGVMKVLEDEYADIRRIFLAWEPTDKKPETIDYYFEEQRKAADLTVKVDPAPYQQAQTKIEAALRKIRAIPKEIDSMKNQAMGKAPRMQRSLDEIHEISKGVIKDRMADLDNLEAMTKSLHADFGHFVKIDVGMFGPMRTKLGELEKSVDRTVSNLAEKQKQIAKVPAEMEQQVVGTLKNNIPKELLETAGFDPDSLDLTFKKTANPWHDQGFQFVVQCRKNLEKDRDARAKLAELGLDEWTIKRAWLGINPDVVSVAPEPWGLKPENPKTDRTGPLEIPPGLVVPRFQDAELKRIIIRPGEFDDANNDTAVEGSDEVPMSLTAGPGAPVVRVEDDLSARLVEQEIGDLCNIVSLKDPSAQPDNETAEAIDAANLVLVILPASKADDGPEWLAWQKVFPKAVQMPIPEAETLFEAQRKGTNIRNWLLEAFPLEIADENKIESIVPPSGQPPGKFTIPALPISAAAIQGLIDKAIKEVNDSFKPEIDKLKARQSEILEQTRKAMAKSGLDPDEVMAKANAQPRKSFADSANDAADGMAKRREAMKSAGQLPPKVEEKMVEAEGQLRKMGQDAEARWQEGQAKLASGKEKIAAAKAQAESGQLPPEAKARFKKYGIDLDKRVPRTREEVIELHQNGESLSEAILADVDLSGLDLSGIDLSQADCQRTNFAGSNLTNANFSQTLGMEADFSEANLTGAHFEKGLFMNAKFKKADMRRTDFQQALMKEADFSEADLGEANLNMSILTGAKLKKARFNQANVGLSILSEADATEADFNQAHLEKCILKGTTLDKARINQAAINSTLLYGASGSEVDFSGANMDKARLGGETKLPEADFRNTSMHQACYRDSDLHGAQFQGAELKQATFENCNLSRVNMDRVSAKKSRLIKSNLEGASLKGVNLFQGSLRKSRLVNTDLRASNLYGVDFFKSVIGYTRLDDANLKMTQLHKRTDLLDE